MTQFDELPKVSTIDALNFWLEKQKEYKSSADFLLFGEHDQRQKYLDIIPFVQAAIHALEIKRDNGAFVSKDFAEWIATNYKLDEGPVVGNIYYERGFNSKDYTIDELWDIFCIEH